MALLLRYRHLWSPRALCAGRVGPGLTDGAASGMCARPVCLVTARFFSALSCACDYLGELGSATVTHLSARAGAAIVVEPFTIHRAADDRTTHTHHRRRRRQRTCPLAPAAQQQTPGAEQSTADWHCNRCRGARPQLQRRHRPAASSRTASRCPDGARQFNEFQGLKGEWTRFGERLKKTDLDDKEGGRAVVAATCV